MRLQFKGGWKVLFLMLLSLSLFITGCSNQVSQNGKSAEIRIGVALPDFDDKWLSYLQDGMKDYIESQDGAEAIFVDAMNDASKQLSQVETFISQNVDAIVIVPVDTTSAPTMVELANNANIPIVVVNRIFDGVDQATAYVGGESIQSGIIQMEKVAELLGGKGNIAIMNGIMGHEAQIKRTEGNKQIIDQYPDMKVVLEGNADFDRAKGLTLMENWLNSGVEVDAVVANNDEMAIGAIMALEAADKLDEVIVAGIDGTPDALEYVESGQLSVTVFQDAFGQGYAGLEIALKAAKGEQVEKLNYIDYELVTKENLQTYVEKWKK